MSMIECAAYRPTARGTGGDDALAAKRATVLRWHEEAARQFSHDPSLRNRLGLRSMEELVAKFNRVVEGRGRPELRISLGAVSAHDPPGCASQTTEAIDYGQLVRAVDQARGSYRRQQ